MGPCLNRLEKWAQVCQRTGSVIGTGIMRLRRERDQYIVVDTGSILLILMITIP